MPRFEGDRYGNPTPEDLRKGAEWLLEQDRLRSPSSSRGYTPYEPLKGRSSAAEATIRDIEAERTMHLNAQDRELIRALILTTPDPGPN